MVQWLDRLADVLGASRYAAHSLCLSSDAVIVNLYVICDMAIALSYFTIGGILYVNRANVVRFLRWIFFDPRMLFLFAMFIMLCGSTHLTMTLTLYYGVYYLDVFARLATAIVSVATAYHTAYAFLYERALMPSIVQALEIGEAPPYGPPVYPRTE